MPYLVTEFEQTPNPNARKALLDQSICAGTRSYLSAEQAGGDPLAEALFGIAGVKSVMMLGDFVTINKQPEAAWPPIEAAVRRVLNEV